MVHIAAISWDDIPVYTSNWQSMCAYDCIGILGVPIFFMISGAIFLNNDYQLSIKTLYKTKVLHLTFLYLFWLLFYNFYTFFSDGHPFNKLALMDILYNTINGHGIYHLWFLFLPQESPGEYQLIGPLICSEQPAHLAANNVQEDR